MANVTYTGASSTSPLVVSSSGGSAVGSPCEPRDPPPLPGGMGVGVGGYDLMTYQRLASALYAHPPHATLDGATPTSIPPTTPTTLLAAHDPLLHGNGLELKDSLGGIGGGAWPYPMYYPYDTLAAYPFTHGYGMAFDAARRKNATRETTATLKAWLNEHKKNPYPTKGEKIMLAIITKMTLTQVSTWFANARRRLKKENKMTWEPRSKTDEDDDEDDDKDDDKIDDKDDKDDDEKKEDKDVIFSDSEKDKKDLDGGRTSAGTGGPGSGSPGAPPTDVAPKPRIWSLADMATSGGLGGGSTGSLSSLSGGAGKMLGGGMARGLHLEGSPYSRPLFPHTSYPYIPHSVGESLLSYSYSKSLAAGFPPVSLSDVTTAGLLAPAPLVHDLSRHDLSRHDLGRPEITRPEAVRPDLTRDLPRDLPRHELARPEPHRPEPRPLMDKDV